MSKETLEHIDKVQERIVEVQINLVRRSIDHDASKLESPELEGYAELPKRLSELVYGSPEYMAVLQEPFIQHHYQHNDHHPEHYENGINGMSLLSIMEMLADWKAASERTKQGSIEKSLVHNAKRFNIDPQLAAILENTVKELGW